MCGICLVKIWALLLWCIVESRSVQYCSGSLEASIITKSPWPPEEGKATVCEVKAIDKVFTTCLVGV